MPESKASPQKRTDTGSEKVIEISLMELHPFKNHLFKGKDDDAIATIYHGGKQPSARGLAAK